MAAHVFYMYCMARSMGETFGFAAVTFVKASLFSLLMLIPLFWAAAIADAPQIAARVRRQRRWRGDACPGCGYPRQGAIDAKCTECAEPLVAPSGEILSFGTIRRFVMLLMLAWALGVGSGEGWMLLDDGAFERSVAQRPEVEQARARRWPSANASLVYAPGTGIRATD
jgi:hypothetical protein